MFGRNPFLARKAKPVVVGHRGVPRLHQENTLAGFRRALALGVPAIELDVRLTADRKAVVFHDPDLRRMTGERGRVGAMTWDQLSKLRIRREIPMGIDATGGVSVVRYERAERIPLLAEVLELSSKLAINVELKLDPRFWSVDVGEVAAQVIADARADERVIVTSFDPRKLRAAQRKHPRLATGFCFDDTMLNFASFVLDRLPIADRLGIHERHPHPNARRLLNRILDSAIVNRLLGTRVVGAEHTLVGAETVEQLHRNGFAIGTHTLFPLGSGKRIAPSATTAHEVERLVALGVDWIETDDPERLLPLVG
ncbi:MAG TPA: glycerophosphodiester phosphodiesterase family protein [Kofleriaceae bacterium]|jgi:glycerophosphoryl diester phosphodiesterase